MLVGEGGGVGEDVVESAPFALIFIGAGSEIGGMVGEKIAVGEELDLRGARLCVEIAHDDDVGVVAVGEDGIDVFS